MDYQPLDYQHLIGCGVTQWNQWRIEHPTQRPDLRGLDLSQSYLFEINLMGSNLSGATLVRACLIGADLSGANLSGANLSGAYLSEANLREANLTNANLTNAQMLNVNLLEANLAGTRLSPMPDAVSQPFHTPPKRTPGRDPEHLLQQLSEQRQRNRAYPIAHPRRLVTPVSTLAESSVSSRPAEVMAQRSQPLKPENPTPENLPPALIDQCQHKLCDYYIGPMAKLIIDDIIVKDRPQTIRHFIQRVSDHIPVSQDAIAFRNSLQSQFAQNARQWPPSRFSGVGTRPYKTDRPISSQSSAHSPNPPSSASAAATLTWDGVKKCQQQLTEYYIAPMAQMLVDDIMAAHAPKTTRQLVQLIAEQLPPAQAELFSRQALS